MSRFYRWHLWLPLLATVILLYVTEFTGFDFWVQDVIFGNSRQGFALRNSWLLTVVIHQWAKYVVIAGWLALFIVWCSSWWLKRLASIRRELGYVLIVMLLATSAVAWIKHHSNKYCPWDLQRYGGEQYFVALLEQNYSGTRQGQCWPGGHASVGFSLLAFYFALRNRRRRSARLALFGALFYGAVLGSAQTLRGAHFVTHNLWTLFFCWFIALALYRLMLWRSRPELTE